MLWWSRGVKIKVFGSQSNAYHVASTPCAGGNWVIWCVGSCFSNDNLQHTRYSSGAVSGPIYQLWCIVSGCGGGEQDRGVSHVAPHHHRASMAGCFEADGTKLVGLWLNTNLVDCSFCGFSMLCTTCMFACWPGDVVLAQV